jgi:hypothetical protein
MLRNYMYLSKGDAMCSGSSVIGLYFSNGDRNSDEAPLFVNRVSKALLSRSDNFLIAQLKGSQITDTSKICLGVSFQIFRKALVIM